jgi:UDP-GlcNAc:undecaprenyl-phosphate/decaprenyl-phosphate GlcNAc-1-phosphate transferase
MGPTTGNYLLVGLVAAVTTAILTPIVGHIARARGLVVNPDERRVHTSPTPDIGGIAMFVGFLVAFAAARLLDWFDPVFARNDEPRGVLIAVAIMFAIGLVDDIRDVSAPAKVAGTVVAGTVLALLGVHMFYFRLPLIDVWILSPDWIPLVTVVWLLGMTQAINLIDGLDGLAAGIVAIAAGAFFIYSQYLLVGNSLGPLIAIIAVGICVGFLPHNFHPAKIFMGDGGALLLGTLMAVSTSVVGGRADPRESEVLGQGFFFLAPLFIPLMILGVPILDTAWAIVRRASKRSGVATADKKHLHHRLMQMGHGQTRSVLILWGWTALLSAFVLYPVLTGSDASYVTIAAGMLALALYTVLHPSRRGRNRDT